MNPEHKQMESDRVENIYNKQTKGQLKKSLFRYYMDQFKKERKKKGHEQTFDTRSHRKLVRSAIRRKIQSELKEA
jgi:hypothetical protein